MNPPLCSSACHTLHQMSSLNANISWALGIRVALYDEASNFDKLIHLLSKYEKLFHVPDYVIPVNLQ